MSLDSGARSNILPLRDMKMVWGVAWGRPDLGVLGTVPPEVPFSTADLGRRNQLPHKMLI